MPWVLIVLIESGLAIALGQVPKAAKEGAPPTLTVCDILSTPLRYDGQLVRIRGSIDATDEGSWFVGESCSGIVVTEGHVWPSQIALVMPDIRSELRLHSVDFQFDRESERRIDRKYAQLRRAVSDECLSWAYSGLFETRRDWSEAMVIYFNGTRRLIGFGHLGESPGQLLLKSKDDVAAIPKCKAKGAGK
jgi:hypothetical protein